jgi:AMP-binding enzyme
VTRAAGLWPDRPAVSVLPDAERFHTPLVRTFAQLARDVHRAAAVLAGLGVRRGEAVAVISVNCAEMLPLLLAAEAVGIYAPINPGLAPEHAIALLRLAGAKVIVARTLLVEACRLALARGGAALSALSAGLAYRVRVWESHISGALCDQRPITTSASVRRRSSRSVSPKLRVSSFSTLTSRSGRAPATTARAPLALAGTRDRRRCGLVTTPGSARAAGSPHFVAQQVRALDRRAPCC